MSKIHEAMNTRVLQQYSMLRNGTIISSKPKILGIELLTKLSFEKSHMRIFSVIHM
jgi:hypothetical protein